MLEFGEELAQGIRICRLQGRLDATTCPDAEQHLLDLLGAATSALLLDLSCLEYLSSKGLNVLLNAANRARAAGTRFALSSAQEAVKVILEISGVSGIVATYPTREKAIAALAP